MIFGVLIGVMFYVINLALGQGGLVFGLNPFVSACCRPCCFSAAAHMR